MNITEANINWIELRNQSSVTYPYLCTVIYIREVYINRISCFVYYKSGIDKKPMPLLYR